WEMLVPRDIYAFLAADWSMVEHDFVEDGFICIDGLKEVSPDKWRLAFPTVIGAVQSVGVSGCWPGGA
ncbi:hypothetical protein ACC666_36045, partial [Rhizobium johnstonii]